jgi:hypothetical protein
MPALDFLAREWSDHLLAYMFPCQLHPSKPFVDCQKHQVFMSGSAECRPEYFTTKVEECIPQCRSVCIFADHLASALCFPQCRRHNCIPEGYAELLSGPIELIRQVQSRTHVVRADVEAQRQQLVQHASLIHERVVCVCNFIAAVPQQTPE